MNECSCLLCGNLLRRLSSILGTGELISTKACQVFSHHSAHFLDFLPCCRSSHLGNHSPSAAAIVLIRSLYVALLLYILVMYPPRGTRQPPTRDL